MPATPQEGGGERDLSTVAVVPQTYEVEVREWTDGQVNVFVTITSKTARYRLELSLTGVYLLADDLLKAIIEILRKQRQGR